LKAQIQDTDSHAIGFPDVGSGTTSEVSRRQSALKPNEEQWSEAELTQHLYPKSGQHLFSMSDKHVFQLGLADQMVGHTEPSMHVIEINNALGLIPSNLLTTTELQTTERSEQHRPRKMILRTAAFALALVAIVGIAVTASNPDDQATDPIVSTTDEYSGYDEYGMTIAAGEADAAREKAEGTGVDYVAKVRHHIPLCSR
jgi:hypothetical protein